MAKNLQVGETVFVPRARLRLDPNAPSAFLRTDVVDVVDRSVRVNLTNGTLSDPVAISAVHRNVGVLILRVGDFETETTLLEPLAKSVLQYFRLLLPDDMVLCHRLRSIQELTYYWQKLHGGYSHVVLIGHGRQDAVCFGSDGWINAADLLAVLGSGNPTPKLFMSLCCRTGYAAFGKPFSRAAVCHSLVAPYHSVHGAIASQFCQTFFAHHLLSGETPRIAFRHAREAIPGGVHFRLWQGGTVTGEA